MNDTKKPTMPSDEQLWQQVEKSLRVREQIKAVHPNIPSREELFEDQRKHHQRLIEHHEIEVQQRLDLAKADELYLEERRRQGKTVYVQEQLAAKYPHISHLKEKLSVQEVQRSGEILQNLAIASAIAVKCERLQSLTRRLLFTYLSQAYGLYLRMRQSEYAESTFSEIRGLLWHKLKIQTHNDAPPASHLLKLIFMGASDKTVHLYARSFQLAEAYEISENEFTAFVQDLGGLEKIRKAWATVTAADKGVLPALERRIESSASVQTMLRLDPITEIPLKSAEARNFHNDILGQWCLVLAHIDPLNQITLIRQIPHTKAIEQELLNIVTEQSKKAKFPVWEEQKAKVRKRYLDHKLATLRTKNTKEQAKAEKAAKAAKKKAKP